MKLRTLTLAACLAAACVLAGPPHAERDVCLAPRPAAAAETPGAYTPDRPAREVYSAEIVLRDAARGKEIPLRVTCPKEGGPFPVVVFSHGAGGSGDSYLELSRFWAGHGYVVLQPTHDDSLKLRRQRGENITMLDAMAGARADLAGWEQRPADVSFVLDSLQEIARRVPEAAGKMDASRVGAGGHSFGAHTSQLLGGVLTYLPGEKEPRILADKRVRAVLLMSPQGRSRPGLTERSWEKLMLPMMTLTGSLDTGRGGQDAEWRTEPFRYSSPGDKYLVFIDGADHGFGGIARSAARLVTRRGDDPRHREYVKTAGLAFWDAYLKGKADALAYLKSDGLQRFSEGGITLTRK